MVKGWEGMLDMLDKLAGHVLSSVPPGFLCLVLLMEKEKENSVQQCAVSTAVRSWQKLAKIKGNNLIYSGGGGLLIVQSSTVCLPHSLLECEGELWRWQNYLTELAAWGWRLCDLFMARLPPLGQGVLIVEVARSHWDTPHSVGLLWSGGGEWLRDVRTETEVNVVQLVYCNRALELALSWRRTGQVLFVVCAPRNWELELRWGLLN